MQSTSKNGVVPFDYNSHSIRTVLLDDQVWFIGKDVCDVLGLVNTSKSVKSLDGDEKLLMPNKQLGIKPQQGQQDFWLVNESGLYHLIFRSNKSAAHAFRKWVTSEVLPALRKRGTYNLDEAAKPGTQGILFPDERPMMPVMPGVMEEARALMLDVALQVSPGSKVARLVRLLKPMVFYQGSQLAAKGGRGL